MSIKKIFISIFALIFVISPIFASKASAATATFNAQVLANVLIVRSGAAANYKIVKRLNKDVVVKVYEQKNGWYRIGTGQWASGTYLQKTNKAVTIIKPVVVAAVVSQAASSSDTPANTTNDDPFSNPVSNGSSAAVSTSLNNTCLQAIKKANAYCLSISKGCTSYSKTEKCLTANAKCEDQQKAALELCPVKN